MSKRRGWYRLGLVLSAAWTLCVCAVVSYEYFVARQSNDLWFVTYIHGPVPDPPHPGIIWDIPTLRVLPLLFAIVLPLGVIWILVPALVLAFSWVRAGFRSIGNGSLC